MNAFGIVAEYNPFHLGHKYLIDTASALTEADVCVSVMSGNFVQRGGFAYFDKWHRAEEAVYNGVDLVVELPQIYACSSASNFARGGVRILNALRCKYLAFGSESGDIEGLKTLSSILSEESSIEEIKNKLKTGVSFPVARKLFIEEKYPEIDFDNLSGANDVLGIEYITALNELDNQEMLPIAIKRQGDSHGLSASKIRAELDLDEFHGPRLKEMYRRYFDLVRYSIITKSAAKLDSYDTSSEGLGNKLTKEIRYADNLDELIERVKSKRYTYTRISRLLTQILLEIKPEDYISLVTYIRPLAMNEKGASYLRTIKNNLSDNQGFIFVEDMAKALKHEDDTNLINALRADIRAGDIYSLIQGKSLYSESDFVKHPRHTVLR